MHTTILFAHCRRLFSFAVHALILLSLGRNLAAAIKEVFATSFAIFKLYNGGHHFTAFLMSVALSLTLQVIGSGNELHHAIKMLKALWLDLARKK